MGKSLFILLFVSTFLVNAIFAQNTENYDVILKLDGTEMVGSIKEIADDHLSFIYKNESLTYQVKKADVMKVTFASGRVEFFNKPIEKDDSQSLESHHNIVAILPFGYIKDSEIQSDELSTKVQREAYSIFTKNNLFMTYQDPATTDALLIKAGINNHNIQGYTMGEICHILGVEYVVQGVVSVDKTTVTNYASSSSSGSSSSKPVTRVDKNGKIIGTVRESSGSTFSSSSSTSTQNYKTTVSMNIYKDNGSNIYSNEHDSFWSTQDAYKVTLNYLVKRTPFYKQ